MKDAETERITTKNWLAYLKETKQTFQAMQWVWQELIGKTGKRSIAVFALLTISIVTINTLLPSMMPRVFDGLAKTPPDVGMIRIGVIGYCVLFGLNHILNLVRARRREIIFGDIFRRLNLRTTELFLEKSLGMHASENNTLNEASIKRGFDRVWELEHVILYEAVEVILTLIFPFFALWYIGWKFGMGISLMLIFYFLWTLFLNVETLRNCVPIEKLWRVFTRYRVERWYRVERVKVNAKENTEIEKLESQFNEVLKLDRKFWLWYINQAFAKGGFAAVFCLGMIGLGIYEVIQGQITLGWLYPLLSWNFQMLGNLWRVGDIEHRINFVTPSVIALKKALTLPIGLAIPEKRVTLSNARPISIEFKNVGFSYDNVSNAAGAEGEEEDDKLAALKDISFSISPRERVALIGPSGVGKTTIMKLLLRFMDPTSGQILISGVDLREIELSSWLSVIGYVPQHAQVFNGSMRYNLIYGLGEHAQREISDDKIWGLMRTLEIDFGKRLTNGLDTLIGYDGIKLSGGQNQRLMIGAAAVKNPLLMVIDEATSSLDAKTERKVQHGLETALANCGALIVTHRLSTVRNICDKFIMMEQINGGGGQITAIAKSFEELALKSSLFRELAEEQGIYLKTS